MIDDRDELLEKEFDFGKAIRNPYAKELKKPITINLDANIIVYFKKEAEKAGIPYQTLINLYLRDCIKNGRHLEMTWKNQ